MEVREYETLPNRAYMASIYHSSNRPKSSGSVNPCLELRISITSQIYLHEVDMHAKGYTYNQHGYWIFIS